MPEVPPGANATIPEELMLARLAQSEQMREFFVRMWLENPRLAARAGRKVQDLLSPVQAAVRGE